jgi:hypothetical protein
VCGNSARTDLRGGTAARPFPTATFALETHVAEIATAIRGFLGKAISA